MYEKHSSLILEVLEYTNLGIIMLFLLLFTYRLQTLRSYSLTDRFKNYFPKLRIFYCLAYVALSISLISYNLATDSYSQNAWYEYVLQGGGGECIDSLILIIQLGVLRLELKKEQPYTTFHLWYFVYLMIISFSRFTLTLIDTVNGLNDIANLIISSLLVADSTGQFVYWIKNRQSLPEFISHTHEDIDESRYQSQFLQKRAEIVKRSMQTLSNDHFPYINAFVAMSHGKLRINLQRVVPRSSISEIQYDETGLNESFLSRETNLNQQFMASNEFTVDEIKKLYTICGRFQLKRQLNFSLDMRSFIKQLETFLNDLFSDKKCYVSNILKFLKVSPNLIESYQQILEKLYLLQGRSMIDAPTGLQIHPDRNGVYFSLNVYRFMWVHDHYEYYMKISSKGEGQMSYPIKRIQEIEELHQVMRKIVKTSGKAIQLPNLPKINTFLHRDDDILKQHLHQIELFLRKIVNDEAIMQDMQLREKTLQFLGYEKDHKVVPKFHADFYHNLKIMKGRISKALIRNEYVTLYEFKLKKNDLQIGTIMKRFRQIDALHHDLERWIKSRRTNLYFNLPEKVLYKTEIRHEKLKHYLQNVLQIKDLWRCYAASAFFEAGRAQEEASSFISSIKAQIRLQKQRYTLNNSSLMADLQIYNGQIENSPPSSRSSKLFSKIIDDLGNEDYD